MGTVEGEAEGSTRLLQDSIDKLQEDMHDRLTEVAIQGDMKKNECYEVRHKVISNAIKSGQLKPTFWADSIIAALGAAPCPSTGATGQAVGREGKHNTCSDGDDCEFALDSYDTELLRSHLRDMNVKYTETGVRLELIFSPNPFFEETSLWIEELRRHTRDGNGGLAGGATQDSKEDGGAHKNDSGETEEDDDELLDEFKTSGVTWKEGGRPVTGGEGDEGGNGVPGERRAGPISSSEIWESNFFGLFSSVPPHPEDEFSVDSDDSDGVDELEDDVEEWEEDMRQRKELLSVLIEAVWEDPLKALGLGRGKEEGPSREDSGMEGPPKRARLE
uniref:Nucleosome assembly protein n=1 Tax=Trypanosoma congolense (strain IL3000) TaxID=1068625 RepID=G0UJ07_TRYCI|nr:conserved hypothetical protein [Trypanosoma congolense IL3000]